MSTSGRAFLLNGSSAGRLDHLSDCPDRPEVEWGHPTSGRPASRTPRADHMSDVPVRPIPTCRADTFDRSSGRPAAMSTRRAGLSDKCGSDSVTCRTCRFDESNSSDFTRQTGLSKSVLAQTSRSPTNLQHIPGPLIQANEGDQLEITVINQMKVGLTIHWRGLYQASTQFSALNRFHEGAVLHNFH
ncbi:hypothetical protein PCASD_17701 [Puccinia coronata f. sp. avenae]|uniref:Plastocyanin-like domain-containing protein n=1 Tax=Puccinia coronata f. sp. avenae TaxID=200324 RepID=A0A2N5TRV0_9BASI|nr:hypothetical protein PCASD_17701 [Puccinia coronata f. sp. avenae]